MAESPRKSDGLSTAQLEYEVKGQTTPPSLQQYDKHGRLLEPQPVNDANDPLNWSTLRKLAIILTLAVWMFLGTLHMIIAGPTFFAVPAELHTPFALTTYLVGGPLLSYGVASLFWVATGNRYGVRLCFFLPAIIAGVFCIWGAKASTFGQLVAARTLASIFFASPETLGPQAVGDVFFLKDRGKCVAFITALQGSGFAMGPLVGSFIVRDLGWRWTQWIMAILAFSVAALIFVFFPETQYTADPRTVTEKRLPDQNFTFTRVSGGGQAKVHR
jgi:MFS family permease